LPSVPTLAGDAGHLAGKRVQLVDHCVDRVGQAAVLALEGLAVDLGRHAAGEVAASHGVEDATDLQHRGGQVEDELVDRLLVPCPAAGRPDRYAVADPALAADRPADPTQLRGRALVQLDDVIERLGDGAGETCLAFGQAHSEVAAPQSPEGTQKLGAVQLARRLDDRFRGWDSLVGSDRTHLG
jgi:hypothetical protein